ncbi:MAG: lytic transglycosylase domain-containing protein [Proteobacteria bacterium]|nr:lytic transglycosylase domain-containing protein [Pseudomonadota bacterium]
MSSGLPSRVAPAWSVPRGRSRSVALSAALALLLLAPVPAAADIFAYTSRDGVIHFTNIPQPGKPWRRVMRTGPGKAAQIHARRSRRPLPPDRAQRYEQHIQQAAAVYQIPPSLIHAVIGVESDYDRNAISRAGAQGLMQLMPATARGMGVTDVFDARQNIFGGVRFLRVLANQFAGSLVKTLAGYHAGPGAVLRYDGPPPYATTLQYVRMVMGRYRRLRQRALPGAMIPASAAAASSEDPPSKQQEEAAHPEGELARKRATAEPRGEVLTRR